MLNESVRGSWVRLGALLAAGGLISLFVACSSSSSSKTPAAGAGGATCAAPGQATPGAADTHCMGMSQTVTAASCLVQDAGMPDMTSDAGADAGAPAEDCPYGNTMFGAEGDDDDCKYHVAWKSDPICEGTAGVNFTVTVTNKAAGADGPAGSPVKGIKDGVRPEVFIPTSTTATCDNQSMHPSPNPTPLVETPAGSGVYKGVIQFDAPGEWTVRFHIHEECTDILDDSQHGHAAFHITVP